MRQGNPNVFATNSLVKLKGQDWLEKQRIAGKIAAQTLVMLQKIVANREDMTFLEMNNLAEEFIAKAGGTPTFKGYKGFPAGVCLSVNKELVHGIPKDVKPQDGDVISFDLGVTIDGAIADTAVTCIYGFAKSPRHIELIEATEQALMKGIESLAVGKQIGCVGNAVYKFSKNKGFGVISNYGGHGLDWNHPHAAPFVANRAELNEGVRIQPGLAIAIEPMLVIGSTTTKTLSDGWTVVTDDIGAHFEHSVFVHEDRIEIITDRSGL